MGQQLSIQTVLYNKALFFLLKLESAQMFAGMEPAGRELWESRVCQEPPKLVTLWHEEQREVFWSRPQESRFLLKTKGRSSDVGFAPLGVGCLQEGKRLRGLRVLWPGCRVKVAHFVS